MVDVEEGDLISREEVTATLFMLADISANVALIVDLLEDTNGEEGSAENS
jgi:hypothetical protein